MALRERGLDFTPAAGPTPAARTLAALTYLPDENQLLLFGGRTLSGTLLADLWAFDLTTNEWLPVAAGTGPSARMAHTLTYDPATGQVFLSGGIVTAQNERTGDLWRYEPGSDWTELTPATPLPPRAFHRTIAINDGGLLLYSNRELWRYE